MPWCDIFVLYFLESDGAGVDDQLATWYIVGSYYLVDANSDLGLEEGEILGKGHIILQDLQQEQQSLSDFISMPINNNIVSDNSEVSHQFGRLLEEAFLTAIHKNWCLVHHRTLLIF